MNRECSREEPLPDDTKVCPDCGFDNENIEELHALITCEACGKDNSQSSRECWNCDTTLVIRKGPEDLSMVCAGCGRPRSPLISKCPNCAAEELLTTDAQLVQCNECGEFNERQNTECWSCDTTL